MTKTYRQFVVESFEGHYTKLQAVEWRPRPVREQVYDYENSHLGDHFGADFQPKHMSPFHHSLITHYNKPMRAVHKFSIHQYTDEGSASLNEHLFRNFGKPDDHQAHPEINHLDHLTKMTPSNHYLTVFTGLKTKPFTNSSTVQKAGEDHKAVLPAYTSTSLNFHTASKFTADHPSGHHILGIHIEHGSHHGAYIAQHSIMPHEQEFLLRRGTKLHINPTPEKVNDDLHIWHAKAIGNHYD